MTQTPALIAFGAARLVTPCGGPIPAQHWPEFAALALLEPEPALLAKWIGRLERRLGVDDAQRRIAAAGGEAALRARIADYRAEHGLIHDEFDRLADVPFPGEAPAPAGHSLAPVEDETTAAGRAKRIDGIRPGDKRLTWYIARAATRQEGGAEENLVKAGFAVYVPRIARWRRVGRRPRERVEMPLFGGYLFVGLGRDQAIYDLDEVSGLHAVVRFSVERDPRPVPFAGIEALVRAELAGEFDRTRRGKDPEPGTEVRLVGGMFAGWPARFAERREDERIALLLTMFGRETPYVADPEDVELPEPKPCR